MCAFQRNELRFGLAWLKLQDLDLIIDNGAIFMSAIFISAIFMSAIFTNFIATYSD